MKITITQYRELPGGRKVKPGDTLESPHDGPDALLTAYVRNGIAAADAPAAPAAEPAPKEVTEDVQ